MLGVVVVFVMLQQLREMVAEPQNEKQQALCTSSASQESSSSNGDVIELQAKVTCCWWLYCPILDTKQKWLVVA
jgi:hypothetical protein